MIPRPYRRFTRTACAGLAGFWMWLECFDIFMRSAFETIRMEPALRFVGLGIVAIVFGVWRVRLFHPLIVENYGKWLRGTPWRPKVPLPFGPVVPHPLDLLPLALISVIAWRFAPTGHLPMIVQLTVLLACAGYSLGAFRVLTKTNQVGLAYLWVALALWMIHRLFNMIAAPTPESAFVRTMAEEGALCLTIFMVSVYGVFRSFDAYPWPKIFEDKNPGTAVELPKKLGELIQRWTVIGDMRFVATEMKVGYPFARFAPQLMTIADLAGRRSRIFFSLLAAWGVYLYVDWMVAEHVGRFGVDPAADPVARKNAVHAMTGVFVFVGGILAVIRLVFYVSGFSSPLGLFGRIITFRWIIPRYDYVLLTPATIGVAGILLPLLLGYAGLPIPLASALAIFALMAMTLLMGPSFRKWVTTGHHRIAVAPRSQIQKQFSKINA